MKKTLIFALICTLLLGAAIAETAMPCMMGENKTCPMNGNCAMAEGTACEVESCCSAEASECACLTDETAECTCENCEACAEEPYYLLPDSDVRLIEKEELEGTDKETLALMRNEILARHGYPFKKAQYQEYFGSQIWYEENPDFDYNMLSKTEMANVETIKKLEEAK